MKKRKRKGTSIAWFLFFAVSGCLLPGQWKVVMSILAGLMSARLVTSRIRIKPLYATWLIFPVLCLVFIPSVGERAKGWCEKNNPSALVDSAVHCIKEIKNGKTPKMIQNLIDEFPEAKPEAKKELVADAKGEIKSGFSKSISFIKNTAKHIFKKLFSKPKPLGNS